MSTPHDTPGDSALDRDDDPSRREVMRGLAAAGVGLAAATVGCKSDDAGLAGLQSRPSTMPMETPAGASEMPVTLNVNGKAVELSLEPRTSLLDALREHAGLNGTKKGCDHGQCGACTVLIDDRRVLSCLSLACMHDGKKITTVEGLANGDELHPVQAAFIENDGFQCGYCTPGQICSAVGVINEGRAKTDDEIREAMAGNLCRCGAYPGIVAAVKQAMAAKA